MTEDEARAGIGELLLTSPALIPTREDVSESVTREKFHWGNWERHRTDVRYPPIRYPYWEDYRALEGRRFTRQHVFAHFGESTRKGVISSIKWGYPTGGRPGGVWQPFSSAFRSDCLSDEVQTLRDGAPLLPKEIVFRLNRTLGGVGTATTTKIAYFARIRAYVGTETVSCLIYDSMVRRAIIQRHDEQFCELKDVLSRYRNDISPILQEQTYSLYLESVYAAAAAFKISAEQIELFLFRAGRVLPKINA